METVEVAETSTLPASLIESLTLHKTAAISAELINRPDIALAALVHTLAAQDLLGGSSGNTCFQVFTDDQIPARRRGHQSLRCRDISRRELGQQNPRHA